MMSAAWRVAIRKEELVAAFTLVEVGRVFEPLSVGIATFHKLLIFGGLWS